MPYCRRGRTPAQAHCAAIANDFDRNLPSRRTVAPDLVVEIAEVFDLRPADAGENVAAADSSFRRRPLFGDARNDDLIAILGRKTAKPRPRRLIDSPVGEEVVQNRRQKVDRYDHVDVARAAFLAELLDMQ